MKKAYKVPNIYLVILVVISLSWLINEQLLIELGLVLMGYLLLLTFTQVELQRKNNRLYNEHQQISRLINQVHTDK